MVNVVTYGFPWPMVWRCFIPKMQFSHDFFVNLFWVRILWIKSSWTANICHVNKRKWVWYDAQALDAGTLMGFCSDFGEGIISTADSK